MSSEIKFCTIFVILYIAFTTTESSTIFGRNGRSVAIAKIPPYVTVQEENSFVRGQFVGKPVMASLVKHKNAEINEDGGTHGGNFPAPSMETIIFKVAASGLPNTDPFGGEPDPFIQISYSNGSSSNSYTNFARTSTLMDTHEAQWNDSIKFEYYLKGMGQLLQFEIRDHDVADWDDRIGYAWINIDQCMDGYRHDVTELSACHSLITGGNGILYMSVF